MRTSTRFLCNYPFCMAILGDALGSGHGNQLRGTLVPKQHQRCMHRMNIDNIEKEIEIGESKGSGEATIGDLEGRKHCRESLVLVGYWRVRRGFCAGIEICEALRYLKPRLEETCSSWAPPIGLFTTSYLGLQWYSSMYSIVFGGAAHEQNARSLCELDDEERKHDKISQS